MTEGDVGVARGLLPFWRAFQTCSHFTRLHSTSFGFTADSANRPRLAERHHAVPELGAVLLDVREVDHELEHSIKIASGGPEDGGDVGQRGLQVDHAVVQAADHEGHVEGRVQVRRPGEVRLVTRRLDPAFVVLARRIRNVDAGKPHPGVARLQIERVVTRTGREFDDGAIVEVEAAEAQAQFPRTPAGSAEDERRAGSGGR